MRARRLVLRSHVAGRPTRRLAATPARAALIAVAVALAATPAAAGDAPRPPAKAIVATAAVGRIRIDGVLDDPTWRAATWTGDFVDKEPAFGTPPHRPVRVAIAYDDDAIYVAARMWSDGPDDVDAGLTRRDDGTAAERFIVSFDPFRSRRIAYSFAVTAAGVRIDWIHTDDNEYARDYSWDPVWEAKTRLVADGWTAELRIPLGQLRYPRAAVQTWGVDFNRYIPHRQEDVFWIAVPKTVTAWASWFGELRGLTDLRQARRVELIPYLSLGADLDEAPTGELGRTARPLGNAGLDARIGLGSGLTLAATINPDFGQVEADPAIVNLSAYEVTLPEKRPFFIEGSRIFTTAGHNYFYSRRIGGLPPVDVAADEVRLPAQARILGAAKLTGRLTPRTSVGALAAVTDAETAPVVVAGARGRLAVAPLTGWGVARVERELDDSGSTAGATVTTVVRDLADPTLAAQLARVAVAGGADVRLRPAHGAYEVRLDAGGSALAGDAAAITSIATSSTHYFQRPDQPHVHLDPGATALRGWHADLTAARRAGTWRWDGGLNVESPGLDLNDAGVLMSADDIDWWAELTRRETEPTCHYHAWSATAGAAGGWSFGGVRKPGDAWLSGSVTLPSFASVGAGVTLHYPGLLDDETRGGPLMAYDGGVTANASASGVPNRPTTWSAAVTATWSRTGATGGSAQAALTMLPGQRLRLSLTPRVSWWRFGRQYVDTIADAGGGADTYGARYLFATLEQRELAAQLRASLALTPDLALDAYVEPFASVGRYTGLGELAAARTSDLRRYGDYDRGAGAITVRDGGASFTIDDPDFTAVSLRSTVVLRWEIRPGSVLYAVWQQNRSRDDAGFARPGIPPLTRPFTAPGEHVVAVKLSWWWAP